MTAGRWLRQLTAKATPGPWAVGAREEEEYFAEFSPVVVDSDDPWAPNVVLAFAEADARLVALAPELARLAADMADELAKFCDDGLPEHCPQCALLARFAALADTEERVG